jgi:hypothetical protein
LWAATKAAEGEEQCKQLAAYSACVDAWAAGCEDVKTRLGMTTITAQVVKAKNAAMQPICAANCQADAVCASFTTLTTTLTPWDSSASSGSDMTSWTLRTQAPSRRTRLVIHQALMPALDLLGLVPLALICSPGSGFF